MPAFLTIIMMPFSYSISDGIVFGVVSYILLKLFTGKWKEIKLDYGSSWNNICIKICIYIDLIKVHFDKYQSELLFYTTF